jgi:hypothetical protein
MQITLYSGFSKRPNSTKQATSGTNVDVTLKESTSIETPTFILSGGVSSYENITAVKWGSRYYFVNDVVSVHNGITELSCTIDRLATFKTAIGSTKAFIERCATSYNSALRDEYCMTSSQTFTSEIGAGSTFLPSSVSTGVIALTLANISPSQATGGTSQIVYFDATPGTYGISQLMNALYDNSVISAIEKILAKPYDAILSVRYIPGFTTTNLAAMTGFSTSNVLYFGDHAYSGTINTVKTTGTGPWTYTDSFEFDLSSVAYYHTFKWRNYEPYATWTMFLPFYGTITIPAAEYFNHESGDCNLLIKVTIDLTTGEMIYTRFWRITINGVTKDYFAQEYRTTIGVDVPIQGGNRDMLSFTSDIVTGVGTVALLLASGGSAAGAIAAGASAGARAVMDVAQQQILTAGTFNAHGTQIASAEPNEIRIVQKGYITPVSPSDYASEIGLPLMESDTISNHSGYIKCNRASVQMNGTQADKDAVNTMLNSGFFYE